jgi:hypothetical protein
VEGLRGALLRTGLKLSDKPVGRAGPHSVGAVGASVRGLTARCRHGNE